MFTICRRVPMVSDPGLSFRISVNSLLKTSASKANEVANSCKKKKTFPSLSLLLLFLLLLGLLSKSTLPTKVLAYSSHPRLVLSFFFLYLLPHHERMALRTTSSSFFPLGAFCSSSSSSSSSCCRRPRRGCLLFFSRGVRVHLDRRRPRHFVAAVVVVVVLLGDEKRLFRASSSSSSHHGVLLFSSRVLAQRYRHHAVGALVVAKNQSSSSSSQSFLSLFAEDAFKNEHSLFIKMWVTFPKICLRNICSTLFRFFSLGKTKLKCPTNQNGL